MVTLLFTSDKSLNDKIGLENDSIIVSDVDGIKKLYKKGYKIILDFSHLSNLSKDIDCLSLFSDDELSLFIEGCCYCLSDEKDIIEQRKKALSEKNWSVAKILNQVLLSFDYIRKRTVQKGCPNYFQIETTRYCNARCIMCSHYYMRNEGAKHIDKEIIDLLEPSLPYVFIVGLHGMGEPFLHPKIEGIIDLYSNYGVKLSTNSNISLLTDSLIKQIDENFTCIDISCDGMDAETFESIRLNLSFEKFLSNLEKLKNHCTNVTKRINMVIMPSNIGEIEDVVRLAHRMDITSVVFSNLQPSHIIGNEDMVMDNYPLILNYYSQRAYALGRKLGIEVFCPVLESDMVPWSDELQREYDRMIEKQQNRRQMTAEEMHSAAVAVEDVPDDHYEDFKASNVRCSGICEWLNSQIYVDLEGNTNICSCKGNRRIYATGKVTAEHKLNDIWNNERYQKIREIFYSGYLPECCVDCALIELNKIKYLHVYDIDHLLEERRKLKLLIGE